MIAVAAVLAWSARARTPRPLVFNNIVALTVYPVAGGLLFKALGDPGADATATWATAGIVFGVYLATNFLNFLLIVGYLCLRDRAEPRRRGAAPLPAGAAVGGRDRDPDRQHRPGLPGGRAAGDRDARGAAVLLPLPAGVGASRRSASATSCADQVEELEALHHGVIRVMVETLGMRDRMTARHSAAVARFAKATAAAAGLPSRDQELVHTAGLLHDVGKFTFPDHTLTGTRLTEEDWELIRSHPQRGADIVGRVHGYAEVAEIVLCHHERVDGRGYPRHLSGDDIPALARVLAVADCFDVMTARDSYRTPMPFEDAIAELRRVAGTQLDARFVEIFVGIVMGAGVDFQHADDEDLEAELPAPGPARIRGAPRERADAPAN